MARILVIDDDWAVLQTIQDVFEAMLPEHEVVCCANGIECLHQLGDHSADLVLLDIMMPGTDGVSIARSIKKMVRCANIPIIFLTARAEQTKTLLESGLCADCIAKPFSVQDFCNRISQAIGKKREGKHE